VAAHVRSWAVFPPKIWEDSPTTNVKKMYQLRKSCLCISQVFNRAYAKIALKLDLLNSPRPRLSFQSIDFVDFTVIAT
jgi:hypothetical protein